MLIDDNKIWLSSSDKPQYLNLKLANRHGLIAGSTGSGKTTTLRVMAEAFSLAGIPVFISDIKGDLSGLSEKGEINSFIEERLNFFGLNNKNFYFQQFPVTFWDVFGRKGHPVRATISEMGPLLLSNILALSEAQEGILQVAFKVADVNKLLLIDLKDLKSMLQFMASHADELSLQYGNISKTSVSAIIRKLLQLESEGENIFFGEPCLDLSDWFRLSEDGRGYVNLLECEELFQKPKLYATFMLWMLAELYELLPEVGDIEKPKIVFFFDEAHLLFDDAPKVLLQKIDQLVRLVRSKGVGIYFITQSPTDLPSSVLAQLANRIQHNLRAYTPNELKIVKAAADTFRANPVFDTQEAILNLGIGEALVSFLDEKGVPSVVEKSKIIVPQSSFKPLSASLINQLTANDNLANKYDVEIDRESAYELLNAKLASEQEALKLEKEEKEKERRHLADQKEAMRLAKAKEKKDAYISRQQQSTINSFKRSIFNTIGREITRTITRSLLGILRRR